MSLSPFRVVLMLSSWFCFGFWSFLTAGWTRHVLGGLPCRAGGLHPKSERTCSAAWKLSSQQFWTRTTVSKLQTRPQRRPGHFTSSKPCSDWWFATLCMLHISVVEIHTHDLIYIKYQLLTHSLTVVIVTCCALRWHSLIWMGEG